MASSPSPLAVALIVGCATVTIGAMWTTVGYFARQFINQQRENHKDTLEALGIARDIKRELPRVGMRLTRLEAGALIGVGYAAWMAWRQQRTGSL